MPPNKVGRPKTAGGPRKRGRPRKSSWDYEDVDVDEESEDDSDDEESKPPRQKRGRAKKEPVRKKKVAYEALDEEKDELKRKHRGRKEQFESDSERLLHEVRELANQERKTHEKLVEKLKRDVTTLSKQAEQERKGRQKDVDALVAEKMREYDAQQSSRDDGDAEKKALKERIKELESQFASFKRSTGPDDVVTVNAAAASAASAMQNSEAILQLNQANKLLEIYRLVTSTDIRLIQSTEEDEQEGDDCTEIVCTTTDSATGNQFDFELAVPSIASSEIEYLPSEKPPTGIKVPSYLREELSFSRSEMTKFIRSVLDVVIRKKKV